MIASAGYRLQAGPFSSDPLCRLRPLPRLPGPPPPLGGGEHLDQAVRGPATEAEIEQFGGFGGFGGGASAAREEPPSYAARAASASPGWAARASPSSAASSMARLAPSPEGGIRWAASPSRVTPRDALPAVLVRQGVQDAGHRSGLAVGGERRHLRRPPRELPGDPLQGRGPVGEVEGVDPRPVPGELDVGVQHTPAAGLRRHRAAGPGAGGAGVRAVHRRLGADELHPRRRRAERRRQPVGPPGTDRAAHLGAVADSWAELDSGHYPFTREVAGRLRVHDDEAEFLAGADLILGGIAAGLR